MPMRRCCSASRILPVSAKSVLAKISLGSSASHSTFSAKADALATNVGVTASGSCSSSYTSQKNEQLPSLPLVSVSISAAECASVPSFPSTMPSTAA